MSVRAPRLIAELYGTTSLADCRVALRHLASPRSRIQGPSIERYEREFASAIGVRHAVSFASGRVGLYALLRAFGVGPGDEVLLQVPTHVVVPNAIRYVGARPVYVDCTLDTFNMDLEEAERRVTDRTRVLLLQHTFGIPADMDRAMDLARRRGLVLIEDCVHSLGATYRGRPLGSLGDAAFFSTEETKTISSTMGGMAVSDDPDVGRALAEFQQTCEWPKASVTKRYLLKLVVYHVFTHPLLHPYVRPIYVALGKRPRTLLAPQATTGDEKAGGRPVGYEQRLSNAQAELALGQLRRLRLNIAHRAAVARSYQTELAARGWPVPRPPAGAEPAYVRYPVLVEDKPGTMRAARRSVVLGGWFSSIIGEARTPEEVGYERGSCPRAEFAAAHLVNLPTHLRVREQDIATVLDTVVRAGPPQ